MFNSLTGKLQKSGKNNAMKDTQYKQLFDFFDTDISGSIDKSDIQTITSRVVHGTVKCCGISCSCRFNRRRCVLLSTSTFTLDSPHLPLEDEFRDYCKRTVLYQCIL